MCETVFGLDAVSPTHRHGNRQFRLTGLLYELGGCLLAAGSCLAGWENDIENLLQHELQIIHNGDINGIVRFRHEFCSHVVLIPNVLFSENSRRRTESQGHGTLSCHVCEKTEKKIIFHNSHFLYGHHNGKVRIAFSGKWSFCAALRRSKCFMRKLFSCRKFLFWNFH